MTRRRRRRRASGRSRWARIAALILLGPPTLYLLAALIGSLLPLNSHWDEADTGTSIWLVSNGVHLDIAFPVVAQGLDWREDFPPGDFADPAWANASHVMIGAGDRGVYTTSERWSDLSAGVALAALVDGDRVMHVQYVPPPGRFAAAEIRLRPEEYRRLYQAVRASFDLGGTGRPLRLDTDGYYASDAFYEGRGGFSALMTCNQWVASRLRLAGVETSAWSPFAQGLPWRYRNPSEDVTR
ncbi:TIGR02117 family protein [Sphingomicrobium sp. XHP0239]|uniref:TIGR02117 family protein n=1 Tax=Sphingomicrobium maritimum TaxID=3133972 RepID=UPI0031CCCC1D